MYQWDWGIVSSYSPVFIQGALITLGLTAVVVIFGTILGSILVIFRKSDNLVVSFLVKLYVQIFRALPTLVLLIWIFYVTPIFTGWRMSAFVAAAIALSLHLAAFVAETVRAGYEAVPLGQYESGLALGMSNFQVMFGIISPQAIRNIIPNLIGLYITELKNSSLASVIAVGELLHRSNILISQTFRPLEIYTAVAVVYLIIILPFVYLVHLAERHFGKSDKQNNLSNAAGN